MAGGLNMLKDKAGFTLIELMITMGLIGLIGGLGVTVYLQANKTFDMAEDKWTIQSDMQRIASFMNKYMKHAYDFKIAPDSIPTELADNEHYFYLKDIDNNEFGSVIYKNKNNEKRIAGNNNSRYEYSLNFTKEDSQLLSYTITAKDPGSSDEESSYEIESSIYLSNMTRQSEIANSNGDSAYFKSVINQSGSPSPELSTFCFIATASYGARTDFPVKVLRMFRDLYLKKSVSGRRLVKFYYKYSPPIASYIEERSFLSFIVRILLLPFVLVAYMIIISKPIYLLIGIVLLLVYYNRYLNQGWKEVK